VGAGVADAVVAAMSAAVTPTATAAPVVVGVVSFGYRHLAGAPPRADLTVDVREQLRDPHVDPGFRMLTGRDAAVVERVLTTPGAAGLLEALVAAVVAVAPGARAAGRWVRVAIGCAGGRHRSVVLADALAARVTRAGFGVEVTHLHVREPVCADRAVTGAVRGARS